MTHYSISKTNLPVELKQIEHRSLRYKRQNASAYIAETYTGHRVKNCMRSTSAGSVHVLYNSEHGKAFYKGLQTCSSTWDCPICSSKISSRRAEELRKAGYNWAMQGKTCFMVTFTVQHNKGDRLFDLMQALSGGVRFVKSGAPWQRIKERYYLEGSVTGAEVTYSRDNGWHYHKHVLFFSSLPVGYNLDAFKAWVYQRYNGYLKLQGFYSSEYVGVDVSPVVAPNEALNTYVAKWGLSDELTRSESKKSITPFDLLDSPDDYYLFREYSEALFGTSRLTWSRGLRDALGLGIEKTDEEIANEQDDTGITVFTLDYSAWKVVINKRLRDVLLARVETARGVFIKVMPWLIENDIMLNYDDRNDLTGSLSSDVRSCLIYSSPGIE